MLKNIQEKGQRGVSIRPDLLDPRVVKKLSVDDLKA